MWYIKYRHLKLNKHVILFYVRKEGYEMTLIGMYRIPGTKQLLSKETFYTVFDCDHKN